MPKNNRTTRRINILGVWVDPITSQNAIDLIIAHATKPGCRFVTKPYVEFFTGTHNAILNRAWLVLPDGVALQWAAYFQATSGSLWQLLKTLGQIVLQPQAITSVIPEKFAGTDFVWPLLEAAAAHSLSVFLVGSPVGGNDIDHTAAVIKHRLPNINIAGTLKGRDESGVFSGRLEQALVNRLREAEPDIVLIGLGFPRQEEVMARLETQLDHGILIGEGGTFDYRSFGGPFKKAPKFIQTIGLEWIWRFMLEPSRLKRQMAVPRFIYRVYRTARKRRPNPSQPT